MTTTIKAEKIGNKYIELSIDKYGVYTVDYCRMFYNVVYEMEMPLTLKSYTYRNEKQAKRQYNAIKRKIKYKKLETI